MPLDLGLGIPDGSVPSARHRSERNMWIHLACVQPPGPIVPLAPNRLVGGSDLRKAFVVFFLKILGFVSGDVYF